MSVIRWLVMQEVSLGLNLPAILNLIWPGHPLLYAHANTTTSDEHSIVTMLHSTRIIFSTYSLNEECMEYSTLITQMQAIDHKFFLHSTNI